jgi:hypothetical protein
VGSYTDSSGNIQGLLLNEVSGTWQPGIEAPLPLGAASNPNVSLNSVSCPSAGNCSAVGSYTTTISSETLGLYLDEVSGTWEPGHGTSPLPAAVNPNVTFTSVSCSSAGNCSTVGHYTDISGNVQGVLFNDVSGTWQTATPAALPPGAASNPAVSLTSVSCVSAGNCSAVGNYTDSSGNVQGLLLGGYSRRAFGDTRRNAC